MNLTTGTVLQNGKYVLSHPLGQSTLGVTFQATQAYLNQTVVLKTLRSQPQTDSAHLKPRFVETARRVAQCQHPGLVRVMDLFEEAGWPFVVMDFVSGQTLTERVKAHGPLTASQALKYIRQAGSALSVIHRHGLVHGDVKPENLIRPKGAEFVVLVDFGMTHYEGNDPITPTSNPYRAIEQLQSTAPLTAATDIYALAATLYFLVTGTPPMAATARHQTQLTPPSQLRPELTSALDAAILNGMAVNAQMRPQTIAAWFSLLPHSQSLPPVAMPLNGTGPAAGGVVLPPTVTPVTTHPTNGSSRTTPPPAPATTTTPPTRVVAPAAPRTVHSSPPGRKSRLPKALVMTAAIAGTAGLGLGLALRLSAVSGIGPKFFNTQQPFPPLEGWPPTTDPVAMPTAPVVPDVPLPKRQAAPEPRRATVKVAPTPTPTTPVASPTPVPSVDPTPLPEPSNTVPTPLPTAPPPEVPVQSAPRPAPSVQLPSGSAPLPSKQESLPPQTLPNPAL